MAINTEENIEFIRKQIEEQEDSVSQQGGIIDTNKIFSKQNHLYNDEDESSEKINNESTENIKISPGHSSQIQKTQFRDLHQEENENVLENNNKNEKHNEELINNNYEINVDATPDNLALNAYTNKNIKNTENTENEDNINEQNEIPISTNIKDKEE